MAWPWVLGLDELHCNLPGWVEAVPPAIPLSTFYPTRFPAGRGQTQVGSFKNGHGYACGLSNPAAAYLPTLVQEGCRRTVGHPVGRALAEVAVRVQHVLGGGAGVELGVALRCVLQGDRLGVDVLGDVDLIVQDRHHQAA